MAVSSNMQISAKNNKVYKETKNHGSIKGTNKTPETNPKQMKMYELPNNSK